VRHRLDDVGAGDEHVARPLDHQDEVGDGGRIHRTAGTRPHDGADLRDDAARERVPQEDVGVARERLDALLDARAAGVVEPDDRRARLHGEIHHLADLRGVRRAERSSEHREILREHEDAAALHGAVARHDAVAEDLLILHPEVRAAMRDEPVELDEAARVEQQVDSLARRELAGGVLLLASVLAAPFQCFGVARVELGEEAGLAFGHRDARVPQGASRVSGRPENRAIRARR
jgi:hypothetical protein